MSEPGHGEAWNCGNCGRLILGSGAWGINPDAVCHCCSHDRQPIKPAPYGASDLGRSQLSAPSVAVKLWLWKNFVDGKPEYWAFDNPYPCRQNGDPMVLGSPCGYAIFKDSDNGRPEKAESEVLDEIRRARTAPDKRQAAWEANERLAKAAKNLGYFYTGRIAHLGDHTAYNVGHLRIDAVDEFNAALSLALAAEAEKEGT